MPTTAVIASCHGTVESSDDIAAFVKNIRRGRPAPAEVVEEVTKRFEAIGGSPFMRLTHAQAAALEARIDVPVRAAARLWHPYPDAVVKELAEAGTTRLVSLPLAPQSTHVYHPGVRKAAEAHGIELVEVPNWGDQPALIDAFEEAIREALAKLGTPAPIVLTAHSLPRRVIDMGDPYEKDFRTMADAVAARFEEPTSVAFQSQGMGGGDWLGPTLEATLTELAEGGAKAVVVAPIGFVAEHVETLYDIDIEARALATSLGIERLERMPPMNVRPRFVDALVDAVRPHL